jgi:hypothetical protein
MEAHRFHELEVEDHRIYIPVHIHFQETGANGVSLAQTQTLTIMRQRL